MYNSDTPNRAELPSKRKLVRSTLIAGVSAAVLLVTVILPAEYGVDPTRIGGVLGLTEMGQIKQQLAAESAQEAITVTDVVSETPEASNIVAAEVAALKEEIPAANWRDETTLTLEPGEAAEVKLTMQKGDVASYEWVTDQGHLNSDLHADGANKAFVSYRKGHAEASDVGEFQAEFDGVHGWFWRNRSDETVEVILRVHGAFSEINRVH